LLKGISFETQRHVILFKISKFICLINPIISSALLSQAISMCISPIGRKITWL